MEPLGERAPHASRLRVLRAFAPVCGGAEGPPSLRTSKPESRLFNVLRSLIPAERQQLLFLFACQIRLGSTRARDADDAREQSASHRTVHCSEGRGRASAVTWPTSRCTLNLAYPRSLWLRQESKLLATTTHQLRRRDIDLVHVWFRL